MKRAALTLLQVLITGGILYWLLHDPYKRTEMIDAISRAHGAWLLLGIAAYGVAEIAAGIRWKLLLEVQGIHLGTLRVFNLLLIGLFFNFFIPGGTGGDVIKSFYLLKEAPGKGPAAVLSVLVDRILGVLALIFVAGGYMIFRWDWLTSTPETKGFVCTGAAILGTTGAAILLTFVLSSLGLVERLPAGFPWRNKLAELASAYNQYGKAWRSTLGALAASFVSQAGHFLTFACAGFALKQKGIPVPSMNDIFAIMPIVNSISSLPISVGGLGVREGLFQVFLSELSGVQESIAVLISTTGFCLTAVWGLLGGLLYLFYRPSEHAKFRQIAAEVSSVEREIAETELAYEKSGRS